MALDLGATRVRDTFNKIPGFQVMVHASGVESAYLWSHHEKLVVVDQACAFVGGIDLCAGRWDDKNYWLFDSKNGDIRVKGTPLDEPAGPADDMCHGEEGTLWKGKDYCSPYRFATGDTSDMYHDSVDDRCKTSRVPWQDISAVVYGRAAWDVGRHFIQRWNFTKKQSMHNDAWDANCQNRYLEPFS